MSVFASMPTSPCAQRIEDARAAALACLRRAREGAPDIAAERALMTWLRDVSPAVRGAVAEALADAPEAPHACILTLAQDAGAIAAHILARSPVLDDGELAACAAAGGPLAARAVASRPRVSAELAAALIQSACLDALVALARNPLADLSDDALRAMMKRFDDGALRDVLLQRPRLSAALRADLAAAAARALCALAAARGWMPQARADMVERETIEKADVAASAALDEGSGEAATLAFARHLRAEGRLTPRLLLRAVMSGEKRLFAAALSEAAGLPQQRAKDYIERPRSASFAALCEKAGASAALRAALVATLEALVGDRERAERGLTSLRIEAAITGVAGVAGPESAAILRLLRRWAAEAALENAAMPRAPRRRIEIDLDAIEAEIRAAA